MNTKRMAELDRHPDRATGWELAYAALASLVLAALAVGLIACVIARAAQEAGL